MCISFFMRPAHSASGQIESLQRHPLKKQEVLPLRTYR